MIPSFCTQTITRRRAGTKEVRGSVVLDWNNYNDLIISPCSVQPSGGYIDVDGRVLGTNSSFNVYVNVDADIHAGDRIIVEGRTFDVDNEPGTWQSPSGRVTNKQFSMTEHKG